jgi:hypothetical protein
MRQSSLEQGRGNVLYIEVLEIRNEAVLVIVMSNNSTRSSPTRRMPTSKSINQKHPGSVMENRALIQAIRASSQLI